MARLLSTKLQPPPLRNERVYRPSLYEGLADFETGVAVVSAPPGFGKSTLVVEWLTAQDRPFAWYSLDRYDGDVGLFSEYLAETIRVLTNRDSGLLTLPGEVTPDARTVIATLVDDLHALPSGAALVLDDYHEIQNKDVHEIVNYLVENLPEGIVLVIVTRADPPLPLSRLRANGRLREIRGSALRFNSSEVAEYFDLKPETHLDEDQLRTITDRSEGWISALQLASLGFEGADPAEVISSLSAQHPFIASYLVDEVLDRLRPELADFLLGTSLFERFDAQLCRDVVGRLDAADLIAEIEVQNAFLIPLGAATGWYRYHNLFAELLRSKVLRTDPERHRSLLERAAKSCEERGLIDDAVDYALRADGIELAGGIVERNLAPALGTGEVARLRSWLRLFPVPAGPAEHIVALGWAWCRTLEGDQNAAAELIDRIDHEHLESFVEDPSGQMDVMRSIVAFQAGDLTTAEEVARRSLDRNPQPSPYMEALAHLYVGRALHAQGRRRDARPHLSRAAGLAERGNTLAAVAALFALGVVDMDLGNLQDAERSMTRAQEVGRASGEAHPASGIGDVGLAYVRLNQLDAEDAVQLAERGCGLLRRTMFVEMGFRAFFVWAESLSIAGRFDDADTVAREGIDWLQGRDVGGSPLETWLLMAAARNSWRRGRLEDAVNRLNMVRERGLGSPNQDEALGFYEAADAVSLALRRGNVLEAADLLAAVPHDPSENVMFAIKRHVLHAALNEMQGDRRSAVESLEKAVDLAHVGYRFQFTFVSPVIRPILQRMAGRTKHDAFVRSVLERLPEEVGFIAHQPIDPLTDRELDVLAEIAAGYSNEEIADRLFISRGTVKRHASNIYLKLGAHHRAEAAAKGRELGLIE